jgi:hypothetical protein
MSIFHSYVKLPEGKNPSSSAMSHSEEKPSETSGDCMAWHSIVLVEVLVVTLGQFNIAMENCQLLDDLPTNSMAIPYGKS